MVNTPNLMVKLIIICANYCTSLARHVGSSFKLTLHLRIRFSYFSLVGKLVFRSQGYLSLDINIEYIPYMIVDWYLVVGHH